LTDVLRSLSFLHVGLLWSILPSGSGRGGDDKEKDWREDEEILIELADTGSCLVAASWPVG
jgi:hypothetical protein